MGRPSVILRCVFCVRAVVLTHRWGVCTKVLRQRPVGLHFLYYILYKAGTWKFLGVKEGGNNACVLLFSFFFSFRVSWQAFTLG